MPLTRVSKTKTNSGETMVTHCQPDNAGAAMTAIPTQRNA